MLTMATLRRLWNSNAPLTAGGLLMLAVLAANLIGLGLDPPVITGMPAWLKPAKFASSTAIYMFTLAWIFGHLPGWPRMRRVVGWMTAVILVGEVALINLQAWRGTTSHNHVTGPDTLVRTKRRRVQLLTCLRQRAAGSELVAPAGESRSR